MAVSIHTPARGVTFENVKAPLDINVSIHTPARGVTRGSGDAAGNGRVSIHTPARGVTDMWDKIAYEQMGFNPHSRKGSDSKNKQLYSSIHYKNW